MIRLLWIITLTLGIMSFATDIYAAGVDRFDFRGQAILYGNYATDNELELSAGARYLPELSYGINFDSGKMIDFIGAANLYGNASFHPFDSSWGDAGINPYRAWARYTDKQLEIRLGLQKIDFGSATVLRPLQWFNQLDPSDPLSLTNGVYALLGRYYFLNNANVWLWLLCGNDETRGFDAVPTHDRQPEFGGRAQLPVPRGEVALSYHHRTADARNLPGELAREYVPEDRIGIDGKWDVEIGVWFEASMIHKSKNIGILTNQTLLNIGADYTFGLGNGLTLAAEHLIMAYDEEFGKYSQTSNISAMTMTYPLGLFDNIFAMAYHVWETEDFSFSINYEHQFERLAAYVMAYYNPDTPQDFRRNELVNTFTGPGVRLMLVYNH